MDEKHQKHPLSLKFRKRTISVWPLAIDIRLVINDYPEIEIKRGGLIIPRTEYRRDKVAVIQSYYPDIYSAIRSRRHLFDSERVDSKLLGQTDTFSELAGASLMNWKNLTAGEKGGLHSRIRAALRRLPKSPRAKEKVEAKEFLTAAKQSRDSLKRRNPGRRILQLAAAQRRMRARQMTVGQVIIGANLVRLNELQVQLNLMERYLKRIAAKLNAMLKSQVLKNPNPVPASQYAGLSQALKSARDELSHIAIQPHLDAVKILRCLFRIAIRDCLPAKTEQLKETMVKIIFLIDAILLGSLDPNSTTTS